MYIPDIYHIIMILQPIYQKMALKGYSPKGILSSPSLLYIIWSIVIIYSIFSILFGIVVCNHNVSQNKIDSQPSSKEG